MFLTTAFAGFVYFASWDYYASTHAPWLPHVGRCAGRPLAAIAGCSILSSYLVLFVLFYLSTYKKTIKRNSKAGGAVDNKVKAVAMKESAAKVADSCSGVSSHSNAKRIAKR